MNDRSDQGKVMPFIHDLGDAMRRNPVSTALIGMGVLWLFTGGKAKERAASLAHSTGLDRVPDAASGVIDAGRAAMHDVRDRVSETVADVGERAASAMHSVQDSGAAALDRASDFGRQIPETGAELFGAARTRMTDLFNEQPLMLGALGVAIGAGIAASLPSTKVEAELFGETSDEFKAQARGYVDHAQERVSAAARDAVDAATEEARRQGLTPEGVMSAAGEVGQKAKRVADAAEDNLRLE
ncbi:hypothetical protein SR870_23095 [Rhodopseudomonas palustris]|uniref:hypothetical protein n=1 Tax=Rhodopseudomonas palustris TaxID=1076 RepID=UPI002ACE49C5|nr:hypothetical protein [Rhodopseudomonas palustris]WQG99519.1 hypothetical protein SR870_23095 [Rhodopseudomonas palustris]